MRCQSCSLTYFLWSKKFYTAMVCKVNEDWSLLWCDAVFSLSFLEQLATSNDLETPSSGRYLISLMMVFETLEFINHWRVWLCGKILSEFCHRENFKTYILPVSSWCLFSPWRWSTTDLWNIRKVLALQRHSIISQKTRIFNSSAIRTPNFSCYLDVCNHLIMVAPVAKVVIARLCHRKVSLTTCKSFQMFGYLKWNLDYRNVSHAHG